MVIIPAIDLRNGKCVRLYQGDYRRETVFSNDPVAMALRWENAGAKRLHLVDLDGAAAGKLCNTTVIEEVVSQVTIPVQVGGGIRQIETIMSLLEAGVDRVILGTVAIENPELVRTACQNFGSGIIVSIDAKDGHVRGRGWKEEGNLTIAEVVEKMEAQGVRRFIYTDIARDGTLTEPNFEQIKRISTQTTIPLIAAGGIASIEHLKKLKDLGIEGAIIGQAIYTGAIDVQKALAALDSEF